MRQIIEGFLQVKLRSTNSFSERSWRDRHKERNQLEWLLLEALGKAKRLDGPVKITVTRVLGPKDRLFDRGNLEGGSVKQLVDALVRLGWMANDCPNHLVELVCLQDPDNRDQPGARVRLEEV